MADTYDVKLWKNTGFNKGNLPANPSVLASMQYETAPAVFKFQERGLATINLDKTFAEISNVDYVAIGNDYYVVGGITMLSEHTASLALIQDPINSAGGVDSLQVISGWVQRAHTQDDTAFKNILPEPWTPTRQMKMEKEATINDDGGGGVDKRYWMLVGVTVDLHWATKTADIYEGISGTLESINVAVPHMEPLYTTTRIIFVSDDSDPDQTGVYNLPNTLLYVLYHPDTGINRDVAEALVSLRSLGVDNAITCSYIIPDEYVDHIWSPPYPGDALEGASVSSVWLKYEEVQPTSMALGYGRTVKNNKTLALWNEFSIISNTTSDKLSFEASEIVGPGDTLSSSPTFRLMRDGSPNGRCYLSPKWYDGDLVKFLQQSVASADWLNEPLALYGMSGSALVTATLNRSSRKIYDLYGAAMDTLESREKIQNTQINKEIAHGWIDTAESVANLAFGLIPSAANPGTYDSPLTVGVGDLANLAGGITDVISGYNQRKNYQTWYGNQAAEKHLQSVWDMGDNQFTKMKNAVVAPDIICPQSATFAGYFGHTFTITHTHLADEDVLKFDRFLTAYGYADDRPLNHNDFTSRTHFNYVKCSEVELKSAYAPMYIVQMAEQTLINGVRLWHEIPNANAYDNNPMRT